MGERRIIAVLRAVSAVGVGLLAALGFAVASTSWLPPSLSGVVHMIGGCAAGFIARRRGWVYGLIVAVLVDGFALVFSLWAFSWSSSWQEILGIWGQSWRVVFGHLCVGAAGGCLGDLLRWAWKHRTLMRP